MWPQLCQCASRAAATPCLKYFHMLVFYTLRTTKAELIRDSESTTVVDVKVSCKYKQLKLILMVLCC